MNRRSLIKGLFGGAAAAVIAPELLLPRKSYFVYGSGLWGDSLIPLANGTEHIFGQVLTEFFLPALKGAQDNAAASLGYLPGWPRIWPDETLIHQTPGLRIWYSERQL